MSIRCFASILLAFPVGLYAETATFPAGPFLMGCSAGDPACERDEGPPGGTTVNVPAFRTDRYEVRVDEFRACVEAGVCRQPVPLSLGRGPQHPQELVPQHQAVGAGRRHLREHRLPLRLRPAMIVRSAKALRPLSVLWHPAAPSLWVSRRES